VRVTQRVERSPLGKLQPLARSRSRRGDRVGIERRAVGIGEHQIEIRPIVGTVLLAKLVLGRAVALFLKQRSERVGQRGVLEVGLVPLAVSRESSCLPPPCERTSAVSDPFSKIEKLPPPIRSPWVIRRCHRRPPRRYQQHRRALGRQYYRSVAS
jgi:hypothetical protein